MGMKSAGSEKSSEGDDAAAAATALSHKTIQFATCTQRWSFHGNRDFVRFLEESRSLFLELPGREQAPFELARMDEDDSGRSGSNNANANAPFFSSTCDVHVEVKWGKKVFHICTFFPLDEVIYLKEILEAITNVSLDHE